MLLTRPYFTARKNNGVKWEPPSSCVLWLPGQDDAHSSTIRDRSGNGNDGAITGATWTQNGRGLWYLDFDGTDDEVDCGTGTSLNITGDITIEIWAWHDGAMGNNVIFAKDNVSGIGRSWNLDTSTNAPRIFVFSGSGDQNSLATTVINDGVAHQIVCTSDGTNLKIYVDGGAEVVSNAWSGGLYPATSTKIYLGRRHHATKKDYIGNAALARIYNRALSAAEILSHYNQERHLFGV